MTAFDHLHLGTGEDDWLGAGWLAELDPLPPPRPGDRVVVLAAHPDDETLGAGGLIAGAHARGIPVHLIVATDGEGSHPDSSAVSPEAMRRVRRAESAAALEALAPAASVDFLGLPDGALGDHAFGLREALDAAIARDGAGGLVVVAPWHRDGHGDHEAAGGVARAAAAEAGVRLLEYPIWLWHWAGPDDPEVPWRDFVGLRLSDDALEAKRRAIAAHASQTRPLSEAPADEAIVGEHMQRHFTRDTEVYVTTHTSRGGVGGAASASLDGAFFDRFYKGDADPWGFETRWYEQRKRALTLAALPRERFRSALEVGCSTGVLTAELAPRCDRLLGIDVAQAPLDRARARLGGAPGVLFERASAPQDWPDGVFDLIVLSEVGYYLSAPDLDALIALAVGSLAPDGVLLACHWRHPVSEYPLTGDAVHRALGREAVLERTVDHSEEDFLLEVFQRPPARSVARETGLLP